jgi:hypothetical protein
VHQVAPTVQWIPTIVHMRDHRGIVCTLGGIVCTLDGICRTFGGGFWHVRWWVLARSTVGFGTLGELFSTCEYRRLC